MSASGSSLSYGVALKPQGNIAVSTFVKIDTNNDFSCLQAGAGDTAVAISREGTDLPPIPSVLLAQQWAGQLGDASIPLYWPGQPCLLLAGTAGYARGDRLKPGSGGAAYTGTSGDVCSAIAIQTIASGGFGYVIPTSPTKI